MPESQLKKIRKTNLILLIAFVLIASIVYALKEYQAKKTAIFLPLDILNLQEIVIHQTPSIHLKKIADKWHVIQEENLPANPKAMQDILDILATPLRDEYPISEVSLKELSLAPPNLKVELNGESLTFGRLSPLDQMHYIHFRDKIYLGSPFLKIRFSQTLDTFLRQDEISQEPTKHSKHGEH